MAKTYFKLTGAYDGLEVRRLRYNGRLVFFQIFSDGAPYFLLQIQNFNPEKDCRKFATVIDPAKNNTWRFVDAGSTNRKYEQLLPFFPPRIYTVPPPASLAKLAEMRAIRAKSLARKKQGADLVSITMEAAQ